MATDASRLAGTLAAVRRNRLLAYLLIGGISYVVDAGLLYVLSTAGMPVWAAATIGYWTSVVLNFALNRTQFKSPGSGTVHRHAVRYGLLLLVNYLVTLVVLEVGSRLGLPVLVSKTAAVGLTTCWNFVLYRVWVFR